VKVSQDKGNQVRRRLCDRRKRNSVIFASKDRFAGTACGEKDCACTAFQHWVDLPELQGGGNRLSFQKERFFCFGVEFLV
jgi:hypothetical protein